MRFIRPKLAIVIFVISAASFSITAMAQLPTSVKSDLGPDVPAFRVRPGYRVTRVIPNKALKVARFIQFSEDGKMLFVSDLENGVIYALRDPDEIGMYKTITNFVKNKRSVQGMDVRDGWLYFSQAGEGSISRARDTNNDGVADEVEEIVPKGTLPQGGGHPFEGLLVTDKQIFATSSDPINMTEDLDSDRKRIYVFDRDGKNKRTFVTGVRNVEKLRFRPGTQEIWGFDHGSDNFGATYGEKIGSNQPITDLNPPEEFNKFVEGAFYGHPFIMGNGVPRPEFVGKRKDIVELANKTTQPEWLVHAHWSVLGFTFINSDYFGADHKGDVFFASHGSWNSIKPVGACVQRIMFDSVTGKPCGSVTIVDCVGPDRRLARPVDCAEAPDGSIIFSSDEPPALYRISKAK